VFLPETVEKLRQIAEGIVEATIRPQAQNVDQSCEWPQHTIEALSHAGLMGLHVEARLGGHGQGLLALAAVNEELSKGCASSAMCFGMHCIASAVIAAKATHYHEEKYLRPIAAGKHITTLALSEPGTGAHFYIPETRLIRDAEHYRIHGTKHFVTNGKHAHSYVISTVAANESLASTGDFSCILLDSNAPGLQWQEPWRGMGMRGNSAATLQISAARAPLSNLLGAEGDQTWFIFEIVAPYFLVAMASTYLGISQAALDIVVEHVTGRKYTHSGETLSEIPAVQSHVAEMWIQVARTRQLLYHAAMLGDSGEASAIVHLCAAKVEASSTATRVTDQALSLCGGSAYKENGVLSRLIRDARASHVMAPTTDMLNLWIGRGLLKLPVL